MDRGFDGTTWTRDEFTAHLNNITLPARIKAVCIHCVAVPMSLFYTTTKSEDSDVDAAQRMRNMFTDVQKRLKGVSYHAVAFPHNQLGKATDMRVVGNHASTWNAETLGIEMFFDGNSSDPFTPGGKVILDLAAWWAAQILKKIGQPVTNSTVRFHRDEPVAIRNGKSCPGKNVNKADFLAKVKAYMGVETAGFPQKKIPDTISKGAEITAPIKPRQTLKNGMTAGDVPVLQIKLKALGKYNGLIDGHFGYRTEKGVKLFQASQGLREDGIVGPLTWQALEKAVQPPKPAPVSPPTEPPKPAPEPTSGLEQTKNETNPQKAMRILQGNGYSKAQAAGIVGNLQRESYPSLKPESAGDYMKDGKVSARGIMGAEPTAFGIGQWRNDRKAALDEFAASRGKTWTDFETQVLFVPYELKTTEKLAAKWLDQAETVEQATAAMVWYERPKGYVSRNAKAASAWDDVFSVSEKCDGYKERLAFARALMK